MNHQENRKFLKKFSIGSKNTVIKSFKKLNKGEKPLRLGLSPLFFLHLIICAYYSLLMKCASITGMSSEDIKPPSPKTLM